MGKQKKSSKKADLERPIAIIQSEPTEKEAVERISLNVPKLLHKELKLYCVHNETDMTKVIISAINKHLGKSI